MLFKCKMESKFHLMFCCKSLLMMILTDSIHTCYTQPIECNFLKTGPLLSFKTSRRTRNKMDIQNEYSVRLKNRKENRKDGSVVSTACYRG